ncbi:sneaky [Carabus blaptoides fortunei]
MKADSNEIKDTVRSIRDLTSPITGELEGEEEMLKIKEENDYLDDLQQDSKRSNEIDKKYDTHGETIEAERYKKQYLKKVEMRCEDQLTKAGKKCREMFAKTYDQCYNTVTWLAAWILCWPMKLTFVCNIVQAIGGSKICDPAQEIDPGFGMGYEYLKNSRKTLTQNFKDVKLQYKLEKVKDVLDVRDAVDTAKTVLHTVNQKKVLMDTFFSIVKRALAFVCLKVIIKAQSYLEKYLKDIEFDNIYITKYFRKIDARRKLQDKSVLLPLKKIERQKIIDSFAAKPLKTEQEEILGKSVKLILELMITHRLENMI